MKRFSEQLQNKAATIRLRADEKRELRERVVSYMEYHPLPTVLPKVAGLKKTAIAADNALYEIKGWRFLQVSGVMFGMFLLSISYFAEQAIPGDSLYAVKVQFNEEVRSSLARSPYEKVVWETERLSRRISEARLLASEGKLTEAVETEVANAVREHSESAQREIEILKQTDKEEAVLASLQLATAINVQSTTLRKNEEISSDEGQSTDQIASVLADLAESESQINSISTTSDTLPSYERLTAHLEQETTRAHELLKSLHAVATNEEQQDLQRRLEDVERAIAEAMKASGVDDVLAREQLMQILQNNQKLIVFMTNIDVKNAVTVEEIVPITPTSDEQRIFITKTAKETLARLALAEVALSSSTAALVEKIVPALEGSRNTVAEVLATLEQPEADLAWLVVSIRDAAAIANDIALLLNLDETPVIVAETESVFVPVVEGDSSTGTVPVEQAVSSTTATGTSSGMEEDLTVEASLVI